MNEYLRDRKDDVQLAKSTLTEKLQAEARQLQAKRVQVEQREDDDYLMSTNKNGAERTLEPVILDYNKSSAASIFEDSSQPLPKE